MFSTMLICVGVLLTVSGGIAIGLHRSVAALAARILGRRPVSIAEVVHDGPVRIDGTVTAGGEGTLIAPCSGEVVVWFRLRLRNFAGGGSGDGGGGSVWITAADEQCGMPFHVEDGSGAHAEIMTSRARVMAKAVGFRELPLGAHDRVRLFLDERGIETCVADAYEEECLRVGERVSVAGPARREAGAPVPIPYRDVPSSRLIVEAGPGQELVVGTPEAVRRARGGVYRGGWVAMVLGIAMIAVGLVGRWGGYDRT